MTQPVLIDGTWRTAVSVGPPFSARNPASGEALPQQYPVSDWADLELALDAGHRAKQALREADPGLIPRFLEAYADSIEARADDIAAMASLETGLPVEPRLRAVELPRTTAQLRQAAAAAGDGSWRRPTLDTALNIRSIYAPLDGPVLVFGPNNFPLAFNGISGGDFAAAVAAGNPVIAKAHPSHPGVTQLLAQSALDAIHETGAPRALVQMVYHVRPEDGLRLVAHPLVGATAFTGSRKAGMALKAAADAAGRPIYLEMSSLNPVFLLSGALRERGDAIAFELFSSCTLGVGQFCTKPGLTILVDDDQGRRFVSAAVAQFQGGAAGVLLSERGPEDIAAGLSQLQALGAELLVGGSPLAGSGYRFENSLLRVSGARFLAQPDALQTEVFGPVSLLALAEDADQLLEIAARLHGNLTGGIYSHSEGEDDALYEQLEPILRPKVGRLLNDKMPTGVAVTPAMNHGGPYPATGHPGFTAVGIPASLLRFAALHCYDNVRTQRLPPELRDVNPTGSMWRFVDGHWTQADA